MSEIRSVRIYRWVTVWLAAGVVIALLLLANSVRDYYVVSRIIAREQVRHQMSQYAATLEQQLRRNEVPVDTSLNVLMTGEEKPLWAELRGGDGRLIESVGAPAGVTFSREEEVALRRVREPVSKVVATAAGQVVVEVFEIRAGGPGRGGPPQTTAAGAQTAAAGAAATGGPGAGTAATGGPGAGGPGAGTAGAGTAGAGTGRRPAGLLRLEMAMPLKNASSAPAPIRNNLIIDCLGAAALLATVVIAGLGFRSFVRRQQLEDQLEIARQVQSELLPPIEREYAGVAVATEYKPAEEVGGDFYDVYPVNEGGVALVMGDVSGKGVPAALLMGVIHGAVRSSRWTESTAQHELESVQLNRLLCECASGERYASMFWSYHDVATHTLAYVNAGHCVPFVTRRGGSGVEVFRLDEGGPVLGILGAAGYRQGRVELAEGDVLMMYSDGLVEATNPAGEEFGEKRLQELVAATMDEEPEAIRRRVLGSLAEFTEQGGLRDDLTFVVVRFGGAAAGSETTDAESGEGRRERGVTA